MRRGFSLGMFGMAMSCFMAVLLVFAQFADLAWREIWFHILVMLAAGGLAIAFVKTWKRSALQFWALLLLLVLPSAIFAFARLGGYVRQNSPTGFTVGFLWIATITGLVLTIQKRFLDKPWLFALLAPVLYVVGYFVALILAVIFGILIP